MLSTTMREVMRYINGGTPTPRAVIDAEILKLFVTEDPGCPAYGFWAAERLEDGAFLGWLAFRPRGSEISVVEIGYRFRREVWGKGYATEGARALIDVGFETYGVSRVTANTYGENVASRRVMEKLGMRFLRAYRIGTDDLANADTSHVTNLEVWDGDDVEYVLDRADWAMARSAVGLAHARQLTSLDRDNWQPEVEGTLLFLRRAEEVLLIRKLTGHGAGKINGPGGKREPDETALDCALREVREEVGLTVPAARLAGVFRFIDLVDADWLGHVFVADVFTGSLTKTAEADPFWCPIAGLPFDEMWPDDRFWLPRVLAGERLRGSFLFDAGRLLAHRLERVDELNAF